MRPPILACHAITEIPTANGRADYGFFVNGIFLGITEAKKVTVNPQNVLAQAKRYSSGAFNGPGNSNRLPRHLSLRDQRRNHLASGWAGRACKWASARPSFPLLCQRSPPPQDSTDELAEKLLERTCRRMLPGLARNPDRLMVVACSSRNEAAAVSSAGEVGRHILA